MFFIFIFAKRLSYRFFFLADIRKNDLNRVLHKYILWMLDETHTNSRAECVCRGKACALYCMRYGYKQKPHLFADVQGILNSLCLKVELFFNSTATRHILHPEILLTFAYSHIMNLYLHAECSELGTTTSCVSFNISLLCYGHVSLQTPAFDVQQRVLVNLVN